MERLASEIDRDRRPAARQVDVEADVGVVAVDGGAFAASVAEHVGDRVLDPEGCVAAVADPVGQADGVDGDGLGWSQVFPPADRGGPLVQRVPVADREPGELREHPAGHPRPAERAVCRFEAAQLVGAGSRGAEGDAELRQLVGERVVE